MSEHEHDPIDDAADAADGAAAGPDSLADRPDVWVEDPDAHMESQVVDEYAGAREGVDPDAARLAALQAAAEEEAERARLARAQVSNEDEQDPVETASARRWFWVTLWGTAALALIALVLHGIDIGPKGLDTWFMVIASLSCLGSVFLYPRADFKPAVDAMQAGSAGSLAALRHRNELILNGLAITFALFLVALAFIELVAFLVAVGVMADLSSTQITLAKNFVWLPALMLLTLVGGIYARTKVPSQEPAVPHEEKIVGVSAAVFALSSVIASFFALGIPAVVAVSDIHARQGIYIQGIAMMALLVIANLRMAFPNVFKIIEREVERSKEVDRREAQKLHKRMVRNYVVALLFVVGSIAFLVSKATGLVRTQGSNQMDVVLIVYLLFGVLFLGVLTVNYYQSRQLRHKIFRLPKDGDSIGKRRYRPEEVTRYMVIGISAGGASIFLLLTALVGSGSIDAIGPFSVTKAVGTDMFVMAALFTLGPYGFYYAREAARIRLIDEKFPDFLRDLAESQRAGMTLPRALVTSAQGEYGPLTKEIKIMSSQVQWGVNFTEALSRFSRRTRTPLIERTVSLVIEAAQSGGNVVDILSAASDDAREIKNIINERKTQMGVYSLIIYIAFFVFLTVIAVLNSQFIPELARSTSQVAGTSLGGIEFGNIDVPVYQRLFFHAALIQAIGGGLVSGVMTEGHPLSGLRHSFIMTLVAYALFRFVVL